MAAAHPVPMGSSDWGNFTRLHADHTAMYSAIEGIQYIMATLSIIGSGAILIHAMFQNSVRSPEVRPLFYLSFFDLLLALCWLTGAVLYRRTLKNQNLACYNLQTVGQLFYISSFFYTVNYAWHLYTELKGKMYNMSPLATEYVYRVGRIGTVVSGLAPLVLVLPVFLVGNIGGCYRNVSEPHRCLLLHTGAPNPNSSTCAILHFYGSGILQITFLFTVIATMVLLIKAHTLYKKYSNSSAFVRDQHWAAISVAKHRMLLYPVAFFICWTPAVVLSVARLVDQKENTDFQNALSILQALTAVSQGLLNCFVYGRTQQMLCDRIQVVYRDGETQTLLSRQQKKLYASIQPNTNHAATSTSTGL
ncbi:transmembrane protein 116 isoform X2 [Rhinatrema bivittatum]|uniref:transmembrane protein 116 isoform X1 n=1 Tax=Rhinatrema bivittatum TaxID=194408 RepID=UPI00112A5562|nr:transmembrane protein 116 isoform X1 [Rhinatrema bivittatum]XP_029426987.1 transmembrane protein 116 isoform X2 [Rhinatrema bivittatum]